MIIRKRFQFNGMHIVRKCSSQRCKKSIHAHTYKVEVFFSANKLDNGMMIMDFGLMKNNIKDIIKSFDNAYSLWSIEDKKFKKLIYNELDRVITMPVSPSAESYSLMLLYIIDKVIQATQFNNGESGVRVESVSVHETRTGYATSDRRDLDSINYKLSDIKFSKAIKQSWSDPKMYKKLKQSIKANTKCFINPVIKD